MENIMNFEEKNRIPENGINTNKEDPAQDTQPTSGADVNGCSGVQSGQPTNGTDADNTSPVVQTAQTVSGASLNSGNKGIPLNCGILFTDATITMPHKKGV